MKIYGKISVSLLSGLLLLCSCDRWTYPENMDFYAPTVEQADPGKYAAYLESLRAFKQTEHPVMIVGMDGPASQPYCRNQHPMDMPDSVDYIYMRIGETLYQGIADEIPLVLEKKGTRVLLALDYAEILAEWNTLQDERADNNLPAATEEEITAFFKTRTEDMLSRCNPYGFAGLMVTYQGTAQNGLPKVSQTAYISAIKAFHDSYPDKVLMFRGSVRNILDTEFLTRCRYHVIVAGEEEKLSVLPGRIMGNAVSKDNVVMELTVPSSDEPKQKGKSPVQGAEWFLGEEHSGYVPKGLCVENAHDDYFDKDLPFRNVRAAITALNPIQ